MPNAEKAMGIVSAWKPEADGGRVLGSNVHLPGAPGEMLTNTTVLDKVGEDRHCDSSKLIVPCWYSRSQPVTPRSL